MEKQAIMAVDDEPANLRMLERLFHKDYRVLLAASGEEALKILEHEQVALIITDQRMPGMKGTELLRKSIQTQPDATKIILTGYSDMDALIEAINTTRVYQYVSKPWEPQQLLEIVEGALSEHNKCVGEKQLIAGLKALFQSNKDLMAGHVDIARCFEQNGK